MNVSVKAVSPLDQLQVALASDLGRVDELIRDRMESEHAPRIPEVTAHLVDAGGKRVRPMLTLACAHIAGYEGLYHAHLATAVEFIHTATLLHDDVVDESEQRRGRPTANLLWDNQSSVLVGDYLFARSFQLMTDCGRIDILRILSDAAAMIAEGEVLQLTAARNLATSEETYLKVVRGKTAALFSAACQVGGKLADVDQQEEDSFFAYGDALGIAFQIADDLLDLGGATKTIGKNTGDDFREGKLTLPVIKAIAMANEQERLFWDRTIAKANYADGDFENALEIIGRRGTLESTREEALDWAKRAEVALENLPDHKFRSVLAELSQYVVERIR